MKTSRLLLVLLAATLSFAATSTRTAQANPGVSFNFFYDQLQPYGEWVEVGDNYCWHPNGVGADWRPYADGYWAYTDSGWTWVSYEDYGWITYHYGRWSFVQEIGWLWHPGYEWAPAWVSWRHGGNYVGWAPLPPAAVFRVGIGIGIWSDAHYGIGPGYYNFCPVVSFGSPYLRPVIVNQNQNYTIIQNTTNITNITVNNKTVYVGGPQYSTISKVTKQRVPVLKLDRVAEVQPGGGSIAKVKNGQLVMNTPVVDAPTEKFKPEKVAKKLDQPKTDTGWDMVKVDDKQKEKARKHLNAETGNTKPEDKPARPVSDEELKVVKEKTKVRETAPLAGTVEQPVEKGGKPKKTETTPPLQPFPTEVPKTGGGKNGKHNRVEEPVTTPGTVEQPVVKGQGGGGNNTEKQHKPQNPEKTNKLPMPVDSQPAEIEQPKKKHVQPPPNPYAGQVEQPRSKPHQDDVQRQQQKQIQKQQPQIVPPQRVPANPGQPAQEGGKGGGKKGKPTPYPPN